MPVLAAMGIGVRVARHFAASMFFVDDIVLLAVSCDHLQTLLNVTVKWCRDNRFIAHPDKTDILITGPGATAGARVFGDRFDLSIIHSWRRPPGLPHPPWAFIYLFVKRSLT